MEKWRAVIVTSLQPDKSHGDHQRTNGVLEQRSKQAKRPIALIPFHHSITHLLHHSSNMIGEGIQSSNQRRHSFVKDHVEVGFFTDPSVCIGCKACEVACKEWNHVPDDGFTWSGNSYDNTGHLGASTWRHVMFLEQDRQKGNQITGPMGLLNPQSDSSRTRRKARGLPV